MGISTTNLDKKATKTTQSDKTKEKRWNKLEQERKDNTGKTYDTAWGNIPESTSKRRKVKEISTKGKTIQTK